LSFNPYKGFKPIATSAANSRCAIASFNPYKGFKPIATSLESLSFSLYRHVSIPIRVLSRSRLGAAVGVPVLWLVSIPIRVLSRSRRPAIPRFRSSASCFNPYKGFKPIATSPFPSVTSALLVSIPIRVLSRSRLARF